MKTSEVLVRFKQAIFDEVLADSLRFKHIWWYTFSPFTRKHRDKSAVPFKRQNISEQFPEFPTDKTKTSKIQL